MVGIDEELAELLSRVRRSSGRLVAPRIEATGARQQFSCRANTVALWLRAGVFLHGQFTERPVFGGS
jgi:hypothetical protein